MAQELDIYDDLHGTVHLNPRERRVIDSPWFQRLRRIHQLGVANMVFPGAEHTRFAHSIGVCHLSGRIARQFPSTLKEHEEELRAAALLHDVGHFPFSHTLEKVYAEYARPTLPNVGAWANGEVAGGPSPPEETPSDEPPQFHELFGQRVISETTDAQGIATILAQKAPGAEAELDPARIALTVIAKHESLLLNQIVNSDLDVDQLDYLLRDAKATGSSYGQYDLDYLLECLEVVRVEGIPVLCVHVRGLHVVEHYVLAKYFYYLCILYQKTRHVLEGILCSIAKRLIEAGLLPTWEALQEQMRTPWFWSFDDALVLQRMRKAVDQGKVDGDTAAAISMFLNRQLPKVHSEAHYLVDPGGSTFGRREREYRDRGSRQVRAQGAVGRAEADTDAWRSERPWGTDGGSSQQPPAHKDLL